jgi:SAM-dependent methyltransferase
MQLSQLFFRLTNNWLINSLLIYAHLDALVLKKLGLYKRVKIDTALSPQEMAGFSKRPDVQEAIDKVHDDLVKVANENFGDCINILDIGCGAGAYMVHFTNDHDVTGIDLNKEMIESGKRHVDGAEFIYADFLSYPFEKKFHYIYSISVLEFIPPSRLDAFFAKIAMLLNDDGILFLNYPHALNKEALKYPDLYYIEYSPQVVAKTAGKYFSILQHHHAFDGRVIEDYDKQPYDPGVRTFKNGYLMIAKKHRHSL